MCKPREYREEKRKDRGWMTREGKWKQEEKLWAEMSETDNIGKFEK